MERKPESAPDLTVVLLSSAPATEKQTAAQAGPTGGAEGQARAGERVINEEERRTCVKNVLGKIFHEHPDDSDLFVLVPENITRKMNDCITGIAERRLVNTEPQTDQKAAVYYFSAGRRYQIDHAECFNPGKCILPSGKVLPGYGLMVLYTTDNQSGAKMLIASWHGPYTTKSTVKAYYFEDLIHYLNHLKEEQNFDSVVVGGNFNLEANVAEQNLKEISERRTEFEELKSWAIYSEYDVPADRIGLERCDFIVCWPKALYPQIGRPSVVEPDLTTQIGKRPFRHPVVVYRLKKSPRLEGAEQEQATGEQAETSEIQRYRDEIEKLKKVVDERNKTIDTLTKKHDMLKKIIQETDEIFAQHFEQLDIQSGTASKPQ